MRDLAGGGGVWRNSAQSHLDPVGFDLMIAINTPARRGCFSGNKDPDQSVRATFRANGVDIDGAADQWRLTIGLVAVVWAAGVSRPGSRTRRTFGLCPS